jgi:two-component system sensor histidine kinase PilS (NtrC family)
VNGLPGPLSSGNLPYASRATFWRSLQTLNVTRIVIAGVLLVYMVFGAKPGGGLLAPALAQLCGLYLVLAFAFALTALRWQRRFLLQLAGQVAVDIVVISLLYQDAGGVRSGLAILYLFPLAGAAILAPLLLALFSAAVVTLFMLAESTWQILTQGGERATVQAGLYGAAFFAMVLVLSRFAGRLIGQEELAAQRGNALAIQQAINRLVIADMGDGIIVVDRDGEVFTGNPAASRMLGLSGFLAGFEEGFRLGDTAALQPIAQAYQDWLTDPSRRAAFVTVKPYNDASLQGVTAAWNGRRDLAAHLKVRFATVDTEGLAAERYVIFLQDVTAIENQAQQLKLASMGRLTASIAHEVRNPLSAIGHATALLGEDLDQPVHLRLLKIVGDNVARVNRMVEDILQLSRKVQAQDEPLRLAAFLAELKTEFQETHALAADVIAIDPHAASVRFDPLHLREIVLNLLNNAVRYASKKAGSMHLFVIADRAGRLELHVQDDGPGISPEVRAHLFEPFYTTSSKGTGLGLYLARELCLNNGALLDYEYRFDAGGADNAAIADTGGQPSGRFVITFARQV